MDYFLLDLRIAIRSLLRDRLFTLVVLATLTLAIGSSAAMFAVVNTVLLQPLPFHDEHRLLRVRNVETSSADRVYSNLAGLEAALLREDRYTFEEVVAMSGEDRLLQGTNGATRISLVRTDRGWNGTLGVRPIVGRLFTDDEYGTGEGSGVAIIGYRLWQEHFGGAPIASQTINLGDRAYRVIGVFPKGFKFPYVGDVWIPAQPSELRGAAVFARLTSNVSLMQARERVRSLFPEIRSRFPQLGARTELDLEPARNSLIEGEDRTTTGLLAVAAGFLLIACANVANLLLARTLSRRRELAVRVALGAGYIRQYTYVVVESMILALAGGASGLLLSSWLVSPLGRLLPGNWTQELQFEGVRIDWRVGTFAIVIAAIIGGAIGALSLWRNSRIPAREALSSGSRGSSTTTSLIQRTMVAAQFGLTLTVLAGTGILVLHSRSLTSATLGIDTDHLLSLRVQLPEGRYVTTETATQFATTIVEAVAATPGVTGAVVLTANPLSESTATTSFEVEGRLASSSGESLSRVNHRLVTPRFLDVLGIRLNKGRSFSDADGAGSIPVAIISQRMANQLWPGVDPLGRRVRQGMPDAPWLTVVGVAADVRDSGEVELTWYLPYAQHATTNSARFINVMARTATDPSLTVRPIEGIIKKIEPGVAVFDILPMRSVYLATLDRNRVGSFVALLFGGLGLVLAAVGVYGVTSLFVSGHRLEFGIRAALGADAASITGLVLRRIALLLAIGLLVGGAGIVIITRFLASTIPGLAGSPVAIAAAVTTLLASVGLLAAYVPARRASRIPPTIALRTA